MQRDQGTTSHKVLHIKCTSFTSKKAISSRNTDESPDECRRVQTNIVTDECRRMQTNVGKCRQVIRRMQMSVNELIDECRGVQTSHQTSAERCRRVQTNQNFYLDLRKGDMRFHFVVVPVMQQQATSVSKFWILQFCLLLLPITVFLFLTKPISYFFTK